jgi:hypothetical protein
LEFILDSKKRTNPSQSALNRAKILTEEDKKLEAAEFIKILELEAARKKGAYKRLWRHLDKYIQGWWD